MIGIINFPFSWDQRSQGICPAFKPSISFSTGSVMYIVAMANWTTGLTIHPYTRGGAQWFGTAALSRRHLYSLLVEECFRLTLILDCVYMSNGCCINYRNLLWCMHSFLLLNSSWMCSFPLHQCFPSLWMLCIFVSAFLSSSWMSPFLLHECVPSLWMYSVSFIHISVCILHV